MTVYITADEARQINARFLGALALRDEAALRGAIGRPAAAAYYEQADMATQAAVLIEGIAQSHPFVDANKRTATAAGLVFLRLNGYTVRYRMDPLNDELGQQTLALVTRQLPVERFADWIRDHMTPLA